VRQTRYWTRKGVALESDLTPCAIHFSAIVVSIIRIGWLDISGPLHLHAVFQRDGSDWRGGWVAP
jgi:hypothetical protein